MYENLIKQALKARDFSYSPYSKFKVGSALLADSGKIYGGCNIENLSYTPSCCAERVSFLKAISEGERAFIAIAIVGGLDNEPLDYCPPCGVCRQVMLEFCDYESFKVILAKSHNEYKVYTLSELLPVAFSKKLK